MGKRRRNQVMQDMRWQICLVLSAACLALSACTTTVLVPPRVNLRAYDRVGLIDLSSSTEGELRQLTTQKLIQAIQSAQPGVRILELGDEKQVLHSIKHEQLDLEAIQAIGEKYRIDAILIGHLDVTDLKPKVELSSFVKSMSAKMTVEGSLSARLFETETGSTLWTSSARAQETVAHVDLRSHGPADFGVGNLESAYGKLVRALVHGITDDFHSRYVKH